MKLEQQIFKMGSTTYYWSSKFFPKKEREDIFKLYSFVRVMDNFVDEQPAQPKKLREAESLRRSLMKNTKHKTQNTKHESQILYPQEVQVIQNIVELTEKYYFNEEWLAAFYQSMLWDSKEHKYKTLDDTLDYIYGSAEVIGLMMSAVLGLPAKAQQAAKMQGRAMQFINFLRDINEDNGLDRCYFPLAELKKFGLKDLTKETATNTPEKFTKFVNFQLKRYESWQKEAYAGFKYIPKRYRISVATAVDGYNWTAEQIRRNPMIVFEKKVKPTKQQLIAWAAKNTLG